jgi:hypothetical protein
MSRFKGRYSIRQAERIRDTCPDDFELFREIVGLRLCGVSHVPHIVELIHAPHGARPLSLWKAKKVLSGYGQTLRSGRERGKWFPFGGTSDDGRLWLFKFFDFPEWLPKDGLLQYGYVNDLKVLPREAVQDNVRRFKADHYAWCSARDKRERPARCVSGSDLAVSGNACCHLGSA